MNEPDLIRQQMAQIRHDLHKDVSGVRGGVENVLDWRTLPRHYPLASILAAVAAGYALVPRRGHQDGTVIAPPEVQTLRPSRPPQRLGGYALGLLWPIAEQAFQTYAAIWLEGWIRRNLGRGPAPDDAQAEPRQRMGPGSEFFFTKPGAGR